jgi:hypothetical protein
MKHHQRVRRAMPLPAAAADQAENPLPPQDGSPPRDREQQIREAAYGLYEARGCAPGHEIEDWLAAEASIEQVLAVDDRTSAEPAV